MNRSLSLLLLAAVGVVRADTVYSQPYLSTADGGWYSSTNGQYLQYDNFTLASDATVTSVSWSGADLNQLLPGTVINPTEFEVSFHETNASGLPGQLISTTTIGNSGNAVDSGISDLGLDLYNFSGTLSAPVNLQAGKQYFLEIVDPTNNDDWFWATGSGGDNTHLAIVGGTPGWFADDLAFTLSNANATPEPAPVAVMGLGLLGCLGLRKRSRK